MAEIALEDNELEALMAQLEAETGVTPATVAPPTTVAAPTPTPTIAELEVIGPTDEDDLAELEAELSDESESAVVSETLRSMTPEDMAETIAELPVGNEEFDPEAELAALEAELAAEPVAAQPSGTLGKIKEAIEEAEVEPVKVQKKTDGAKKLPRGEEIVSGLVELAAKVMNEAPLKSAAVREVVEPIAPGPIVGELADADETLAQIKKPGGLEFYIDVDEFKRETSVSDVNLDKCMMEQSSQRAFYGTQAAKAEAQASRMKLRFDVIEARLYGEHRRLFAEAGEKATEKMIENAVRMDVRYVRAKNLLIEAEQIAATNKAIVVSLSDRKDMLVQLGADRREEGKGQMRILAAQQERESLSDRAKAAAKFQQ